MRSSTLAPPCDRCGKPAAYRERTGPFTACEECARYQGAEANGQAYAALETFGFAISLARNAGLADEQIMTAFGEVLHHPDSDGSYPSGGHGVLGADRMVDRPWARIYDAVAS